MLQVVFWFSCFPLLFAVEYNSSIFGTEWQNLMYFSEKESAYTSKHILVIGLQYLSKRFRLHCKRLILLNRCFKIYSLSKMDVRSYSVSLHRVWCVPFWNMCQPETCFRLAWCAVLKNVYFWYMFQICTVQTLSYQSHMLNARSWSIKDFEKRP